MVDVVPEKSGNSDFGAGCVTIVKMEGPRVPPRLGSNSAASGVGVRALHGRNFVASEEKFGTVG